MKARRTLACLLLAGSIGAGQAWAQAGEEWWDWALPQALQGQVLETSQGYMVVVGDEAIQTLMGRHDREEEIFRGSGDGVLELSVPCRTEEGWARFNKRKCRAQAFLSERYTWDQVLLGSLTFHEAQPNESALSPLGPHAIRNVLGEQAFLRLEQEGQKRGVQGELIGRWAEAHRPRARVLQIRTADRPVAEFTDYDGDGSVDAALLYRGQ